MIVDRVKIGYWLLAIGFWRLFSSGFVPAAGIRVRVKIGHWTLDVGHWQFLFIFLPPRGMWVRVLFLKSKA
jgi:hypothetical protein